MKKKIIITSLILILVPSILFSVLYGVMIHVIYNSGVDYSQEVIGTWDGVQYLHDKKLVLFDESKSLQIEFDEDYIHIDGNLLKPGKYQYSWDTGSIARVKYEGEDYIFVISINSLGQMKIVINKLDYIITFNKVVAGNETMA